MSLQLYPTAFAIQVILNCFFKAQDATTIVLTSALRLTDRIKADWEFIICLILFIPCSLAKSFWLFDLQSIFIFGCSSGPNNRRSLQWCPSGTQGRTRGGRGAGAGVNTFPISWMVGSSILKKNLLAIKFRRKV